MLVASAFAIFLTWAALALVLIGVGSLVLRRLDRDFLLLDAFWMGLAVSVVILEIWNFLRPVDLAIALLLCAAGVLGLLQNRAVLFRGWNAALQSPRSLILLCLAITFLLALRASGPCDYYDTGLYGAPAIRWMQTYPVVPGLANLHGRFGLNSSVFLCIAALSQGLWKGLGFHLFTALLVSATWFTLLPACFRLIARNSISAADWFYGILTIPVGFWTVRGKIVGTLTDEPATIACLLACGILLEELHQQESPTGLKPNPSRLVAACTLIAVALVFKQSTIVFAPLVWVLAFRWIWRADQFPANRKLYTAGALLLPAAILIPWCARGIILTGYPFFPSAVFGFPADWKVPVSVTDWYVAAIRFWGHFEEMGLAESHGLPWIRAWLGITVRNRAAFQVPLFLSLAGITASSANRIWSKRWALNTWLWLLVPSLAGALFWFLVSPAPRYGQFAIWATASILGTWGIVSLTSGPERAQIAKTAVAGLAALLIWCFVSFGWKEPYTRLLASPRLAALPECRVTPRQTRSGLTVYVPTEGDQCWDAPLPCTPYFDETLRLRKPPSLRSGFQSDAEEEILPKLRSAGADPAR